MSSVLQQATLVLNRNWQPVHVTNVQRAVKLLYHDAVRVVNPESYQLYDWNDWAQVEPSRDEPAVVGISIRLRPPEVITLTQFDRVPRASVAYSKRNVFKRDRFTCQYCGQQPGRDELTIDHVIPRSRGGATAWENCVLACVQCNRRKANRTPDQAGLRLRRSPEQPTWRPFYSSLAAARESWKNFVSDPAVELAMA